MSAISNHGTLCFMVFRQRFRVAVFLKFLRRLIRQAKHKVFLIVDRHPVHRAARVRGFLAGHADRVELISLPPYSPELNHDEFLNQNVKANAVAATRPRDLAELEGTLRRHLRATQRQPELVNRYFQAQSVRYAAAG